MNKDKMKLEEAIDICKNTICGYVISAYCEKEGKYCKILCKNEDCYLIQAIETVLRNLDYYEGKVEKYKFMLENYVISREKIKNKLKEVQLPNVIVGGRRNGKTLEYGIKLGRIKAYEELLED